MERQHQQHLPEPNLFMRVWLCMSNHFSIFNQFSVTMRTTDQGIMFAGTENGVLESIDLIVWLQKARSAMPLSEGQEEKLTDLGDKVQILGLNSVRDKFPELCTEVSEDIKGIVVFLKVDEMDVKERLMDVRSQILVVQPVHLLVLLATKKLDKNKKKYKCNYKLNIKQANILVTVTGFESDLKQFMKSVQRVKTNYILKLVFSERKGNFNQARVKALRQGLTVTKCYVLENRTVQRLLQKFNHGLMKQYYQDLVKKHTRFLFILYEKNQETYIEGIVRASKDQSLDAESMRGIDRDPLYDSQQYKTKEPQKKTQRHKRGGQLVFYPINQFIYKGISKFQNFKHKLFGMQNTLDISLKAKVVETLDGKDQYVIEFQKTPDQIKVREDLKFFFDSIKLKLLTTTLSSIVDIVKLREIVYYEVDSNVAFKDLIVGKITVNNNSLIMQTFGARSNTLDEEKKLEKIIEKTLGQTIRFVDRK